LIGGAEGAGRREWIGQPDCERFFESTVAMNHLRMHGFLPASLANGPGRRAVLWVQGCSLGCPGCFNPGSHALSAGSEVAVPELIDRVVDLSPTIDGITVSGGEPLQQWPAVAELLRGVRCRTRLSVVLFSGYSWGELEKYGASAQGLAGGVNDSILVGVSALVDVLIAGRYQESNRVARGLRGSANKTMHFLSNRYSPRDFERPPEGELMIGTGGEIICSGIDPLVWNMEEDQRASEGQMLLQGDRV